MTTDPITPLDIRCPTCGTSTGAECIKPHPLRPFSTIWSRKPHSARVAAAQRINRENRRKEGAK